MNATVFERKAQMCVLSQIAGVRGAETENSLRALMLNVQSEGWPMNSVWWGCVWIDSEIVFLFLPCHSHKVIGIHWPVCLSVRLSVFLSALPFPWIQYFRLIHSTPSQHVSPCRSFPLHQRPCLSTSKCLFAYRWWMAIDDNTPPPSSSSSFISAFVKSECKKIECDTILESHSGGWKDGWIYRQRFSLFRWI